MKRLISYIWPITKRIESGISGSLEVTWVNGKKILDTKNANYSFGSLQRILKYGLSKTAINPTSEILLLGLGAGSVVQTLKNDFNFNGKITALEIDPVVIHLAKTEFNLIDDHNIDILCADAISYVKNTPKTFGTIIIDLFIDKYVLEACYSSSFWKSIVPLIEMGGSVIFNAGLNNIEDIKFDGIIDEYKFIFEFVKYEHVENTNTVFIIKRRSSIE